MNNLTDAAWGIEAFVMAILGPLFVIALTWGGVKVARSWMAGQLFRRRGFTLHKTIKLNGKTATITRIGAMDTDFLLLNGSGTHHSQLEFITIANLALDRQGISRLVRVYEDDNVQDDKPSDTN